MTELSAAAKIVLDSGKLRPFFDLDGNAFPTSPAQANAIVRNALKAIAETKGAENG